MKHISELIENLNNQIIMEIEEFSLREITFKETLNCKHGIKLDIEVQKRKTSNGNDFVRLEVGGQSINFNHEDISELAAKTVCELLDKAVSHPCELPK